jgi:hypothetical protein
MFKAGYKLNLADLPDQWKYKSHPTNMDPPRGNQRTNPGTSDHDRLHGSNPFHPKDTEEAPGVNPTPPAVLQTADMKTIKATIAGITLSDIVREAGLKGGPSALKKPGWSADVCLNWTIMGECKRNGCKNQHPTAVDNATAAEIHKQLEPGIQRLLITKKKPSRK